jgi:leader peptidase (prepilin peptidase) / N-methyltransferase
MHTVSGVNMLWAAGAAAAGLPAGAALRGPVFRLSVSAGDPERTSCPRCAAPVRRWLAVRCGRCGGSLGTPVTLELATAAVLVLLLGRFGGQPDVAAFAFLGALGVALSAIDIAVQRLPDRLTLPAFPVLIALLAGSAAIQHDAGALARALLGGAALAAAYLLLALLRPGQLGGGDIKLAGLAGLVLGWLGWPTLLAGAALGFLLSAVASLALLAARRITLRSQICFGPFLLGGTLIAILASGPSPGG